MKRNTQHATDNTSFKRTIFLVSGALAACAAAVALLCLLGGGAAPATAAPGSEPVGGPACWPLRAASNVITVCLSGGCDYDTVQAAVDAASPGDVIKVAQGTYTGVQNVPSLNTATFTATQVVVITKSVTIRGGYTTTNWATSYPITQPTTLDAQGQGRVFYIAGDITPTVEGLRITGGDATRLGGTWWGEGVGGGICIHAATAVVSGNRIYSNTATAYGGGLYLGSSPATLNSNLIYSNTTGRRGGGLYLTDGSDATLSGNTIYSNTAIIEGGGVCIYWSDATLNGNTIYSNTAGSEGGGLYLYGGAATLNGNVVTGNTAYRGGGLYLWDTTPTLVNTVVADNQANIQGSGLWFGGDSFFPSAGSLLHTTIADNGGSGQGVFVGDYTTLALTNTIIASHTVGITVTAGSTATLNTTLWHANTTNWSGNVIHTNDRSGDPVFALDGYHLITGSMAIDRGVNAGVTTDVDGQARPQGSGYDIGADEFPAAPPGVVWDKQIRINRGSLQAWDGGPFTVAPGDAITIVEQVWVTATGTVSFTLGEAWTPSLEWITHETTTGTVSQSGLTAAWAVTSAIPNAWHALTKTLRVVAAPEYADTLTETLTVQGLAIQLPERIIEFQHPRPQPTWDKTVRVNGGAPQAWNAGPFTVTPGDVVTVVDRVRITHTADVTFTLAQNWGPGLELDSQTYDVGAVVTGTGMLTWRGTSELANRWHALTTTLHVTGTGWLYESLTETLTVEGAAPQPPQRVVNLLNLNAPTGCYARVNDGSIIYPTVQSAVDAAQPGDLVKVAGYCTDVNDHGGLAQVAYLDKSITIQGGYTTTNWTTHHPITQPTTLDAQGQGRVLYITGNTTPTIEGLRITGGDAAGLGGGPPPSREDAGGGVYVTNATATISNNQVFSNTAEYGGGLYLNTSDTTLSGNVVTSNTVNTSGGGLYLYYSDAATLTGNSVTANNARFGGGVFLLWSDATLTENTITANTASQDSGGLDLGYSNARLSRNTIIANKANHSAGGLWLYSSNATLSGNTVISNTAGYIGGGLYLEDSNATLTNDVIADNQADTAGSGLYITASSARLLHTTIARNTGGDGIGVYVTSLWANSTVALTNTILVSHSVGITVTAGNTATLNAILWHANGTDYGGNVIQANDRSGDPAFAPDGYHLTSVSAAIDEGVNARVTTDIDGQARPQDAGYDIGADEFVCVAMTGVTISGPTTGTVGTAHTFTATTAPDNASPPISYTWSPEPLAGQGNAIVNYTWSITGPQVITVTAENCGGVRTDTHTIEISAPPPTCPVPLTGVSISGPTSGLPGDYTFVADISPGDATTPITYTWLPTPDGGQGTASASYTWTTTGTKTITITAENCGGIRTDTHTITISSLPPTCPVPLTSVSISGPTSGDLNTSYTFTATIAPVNATIPINYTWSPAPDSGQGSANATYTWTTPSTKTIAINVQNCGGTRTDSHEIIITAVEYRIYLPVILRNF